MVGLQEEWHDFFNFLHTKTKLWKWTLENQKRSRSLAQSLRLAHFYFIQLIFCGMSERSAGRNFCAVYKFPIFIKLINEFRILNKSLLISCGIFHLLSSFIIIVKLQQINNGILCLKNGFKIQYKQQSKNIFDFVLPPFI